MSFEWPLLLLSLLALPLLVVGYGQLLRGRAARRAELAGLGLVAPGPVTPAGPRRRWRHVAPACFLAAFALLLVGLARPQASVSEPRREGTVVLAFDVSNSMRATDVKPSRMAAAKAAAKAFVARQPEQIRIAVVAFSASGVVSQRPTTDRAAVLAAIERLSPQGGTALGRGLQTALTAIAGKTVRMDTPPDSSVEPQGEDIGYYGSSAVILLSDGENTTAPDPQAAADLASTAGVKVYPIGLGSANGTVFEADGFQVATKLDEPSLRAIAKTTDGEYFRASDAAELARVYDAIPLSWVIRGRPIELTGLLAAVAGLFLLLGAGISLARSGRVI